MTSIPYARNDLSELRKVQGTDLLTVIASMKPAQGSSQPSAVRELARAVTRSVSRVYPHLITLDLREISLPAFDGQNPLMHRNEEVRCVHGAVARCGGLFLAVPAYWSSVGGAFKGFIEVVAGAPYAVQDANPFVNRPVAAMVVGSDLASAVQGAADLRRIINAVGAQLCADPVTLGDPADVAAATEALQATVAAVGLLAVNVARNAQERLCSN